MLARNGERPATDCTVNGARKISGCGKPGSSKPNTHKSQDPLRAELHGSTTATAAGITAEGHTPVLILCRQLLAQGLDPDRAMEVWRRGTLALRIRSIGEAAGLEINGHGSGFRPAGGGGAASPMQKNRKSRGGGRS